MVGVLQCVGLASTSSQRPGSRLKSKRDAASKRKSLSRLGDMIWSLPGSLLPSVCISQQTKPNFDHILIKQPTPASSFNTNVCQSNFHMEEVVCRMHNYFLRARNAESLSKLPSKIRLDNASIYFFLDQTFCLSASQLFSHNTPQKWHPYTNPCRNQTLPHPRRMRCPLAPRTANEC
jgi:hypothetical protein